MYILSFQNSKKILKFTKFYFFKSKMASLIVFLFNFLCVSTNVWFITVRIYLPAI